MLLLQAGKVRRSFSFVTFTPDGTTLAAAGYDGAVHFWDLRTGACSVVPAPVAVGHCWVALAPDGKTVAWANHRGITLQELPDGPCRTLPQQRGGCWHMTFSPDGRLVAGGNGPGLWDVQTGALLTAPEEQPAATTALAFSADGRRLATAWTRFRNRPLRHGVRVSDPATGAETGVLEGHTYGATDLAFSPEGRTLAAACGPVLWAWDVRTGRPVCSEKIDRRYFQAVAFTPDGRFLAATRNDRTVRFWDTASWRQHAAFDWEIGALVSLAIAADGMRAAAGSRRGKIVVWDVDL